DRLPSTSLRSDSGRRLCDSVRVASHTRLHFVNTYGRRDAGSSRSARATTSSECPRPYAAAVSTQLMPRSTARWIAFTESASSCGPQPNIQSPPPMAQAPKPTSVICRSELPSRRVCTSVAPCTFIQHAQGELKFGPTYVVCTGRAEARPYVRLVTCVSSLRM